MSLGRANLWNMGQAAYVESSCLLWGVCLGPQLRVMEEPLATSGASLGLRFPVP